ncbi:MAG: endolytic transglycosylase MltG [Spirochaetota bacterium]
MKNKKLLVFLVIMGIAAAAVVFLTRPLGSSDDVVFFEVRQGDSLRRVAAHLAETNLIASDQLFVRAAQITGKSGMKAGGYSLDRGMNMFTIMDTLHEGRVVLEKFAVPEGRNMFEIAKILADKGLVDEPSFLAACRDKELLRAHEIPGDSFEGYLFPSTYYIARGHDAGEFVSLMADKFFKTFSRDVLAARAKERGCTMHELVTMASIVEKEAGAPDERPLIAAVYYNRLNNADVRGRLQSCPTVIYAMTLTRGGAIERPNIRENDLKTKHPYNTYLRKGFPPGPIANPSKASLEAAMKPADVDYLYFCANNKGRNIFSSDYRTHESYVRRYQGGK